MKVLAVDIGASSGRTIVFELKNNKIHYEETSRFYHDIKEINNHFEWDIDFIINSIIDGIKKSFELHPDIASIGIDTWGVDYVYINENGHLASEAYSYRDNRTTISSEQVHRIIPFTKLYEKTGIQFAQFNTIYQLYDDFNNRKINPYNKTFLMIPDYIAFILTGNKVNEFTNASTTGMLNGNEFDKEILEKLNIPSSIFPKMVYPGDLIGYLNRNIVDKKIPVIATCSHDTANAVLGMPLDESSIFVSSGTWSLVGTELNNNINNSTSYRYNFSNERGYLGTTTFLKNTMGMFALNEVLKEWKSKGEIIEVSQLKRMVESCSKYVGYLNLDDPLFFQPKNMINKIHKYLDKTDQPKPVFKGQYIDLIYQSLANSYAEIKRQLENTTDKKFDCFIISGGANQAEILNQYIADASNIVVKTGPIEATIVGNAICQLIALKQFKDAKEARQIIKESFDSKIYYPISHNEWKCTYKQFGKYMKKGGKRK